MFKDSKFGLLGFFKKNNGEFVKRERNLLVDLLKPSFVQNEVDCIKVNEKHNRVVCAVGFPRFIQEGWLDQLIVQEGEFDLSFFIEPASIEVVLTKLNHELVKQKADLIAAERQGIINPSLEVQFEDTHKTLMNLQRGEEKLFLFSLYVNAKAHSREGLELQTKKVQSNLNSAMIVPKTPYFRQQQGLQACMPLGRDFLRLQRDITSNALAACFPFTSSFLNLDEDGVIVGLNKTNNIPVILDVYKLPNYNGLVLAGSGAGKSYFVKLFASRNLVNDTQTYVIDPQGEYTELCEEFGGQVIRISRESGTMINPFDLMDSDFGDKMLSLMELFKLMLPDLSNPQKAVLDHAVLEAYREKGINPNDKGTWGKKPPVFSDLFDVLERNRIVAGRAQKPSFDALINVFRMYSEGSFKFLNRQTNIDFRNKFIVFDVGEMPKPVKQVMMFLIMEFVIKKMRKDKSRKLLVVDEAWSVLKSREHADYLFEAVKTARKFGLGLVVITQEVKDLLADNDYGNDSAGSAILANTSWKLLLRQNPSVFEDLVRVFKLNSEEQNLLLSADVGEGILFAGNDRTPIRVVASPKEHEMITTNPDEVLKKENGKKKAVVEEVEVVEEESEWKPVKHYYKKSDLTEEQVRELIDLGFVESSQLGFKKGGKTVYLIKPSKTPQTLEHYFLQLNLFYWLKHYSSEVEYFETVGPDVVAKTSDGKRIAFEIETGTMTKTKMQLQDKTNLLKEYDDYYFIIIDRDLKPFYETYGKVLLRTEVNEVIEKYFNEKGTTS